MINLVLGVVSCIGAVPRLQVHRLVLKDGVQGTLQGKCIPYCSLLLCKPGSHQALCHCNYTYGDLPFIQVCSDQAPMHSSTVQGKVPPQLLSAAVLTRLTAGTVSLQLHLWRVAFHTGVQ